MKWNLRLAGRAPARVPGCALRFFLGALLSGARIFGGYAPFALGVVAASGGGWEGACAALGTICGAALLLDFNHALRTAACAVLLFSASNALSSLKIWRKPWFLPLLTAGLVLSVEFVYLAQAGPTEAACGLLSTVIAAFCARCFHQVFTSRDPEREQPYATLSLLLGALMAMAAPQLENGFAPGRVLAVLAVILFAFDAGLSLSLGAALCIGLAMDLVSGGGGFIHTACYGIGALLTGFFRRGSRVRASGIFALSTALFALPLPAREGLVLLYEGLAGTLAFLLVPTRAFRGRREAPPPRSDAATEDTALRRKMEGSALALRELYESIVRDPPPPEENPAAIFDRAAEQVCRGCSLCGICWQKEYERTFNAFNDATPALLRNGEGRGEDFPPYFADRCVRFRRFLDAVNAELRAYLLRKQYRSRLGETRETAAKPYAQLSELLSEAAETPVPALAADAALHPYRLGVSMRPRQGQRTSGDCSASFETEDGNLCLLLSDGMGSGEEARRESSLTAHLLERFLRAGVGAAGALGTMESALSLRAENAAAFATVDLLTLSLRSLEGEVYKLGAAPSYIKRAGRVRRLDCTSLPPGLETRSAPPERTHIRFEGGSFFVMLTDGVTDGSDDAWLTELLTHWEGDNPQALSSAILADALERRGAADDALVLVLYLTENGDPPVKKV